MNASYELRFRSLFTPGHDYVFPCDETGCVDMNALSRRVLANYLYARAVIGREFATPDVQPRSVH
jgi:hypothetical protein